MFAALIQTDTERYHRSSISSFLRDIVHLMVLSFFLSMTGSQHHRLYNYSVKKINKNCSGLVLKRDLWLVI